MALEVHLDIRPDVRGIFRQNFFSLGCFIIYRSVMCGVTYVCTGATQSALVQFEMQNKHACVVPNTSCTLSEPLVGRSLLLTGFSGKQRLDFR